MARPDSLTMSGTGTSGEAIAELNPEIVKDTGFLATRLIAGVVGALAAAL